MSQEGRNDVVSVAAVLFWISVSRRCSVARMFSSGSLYTQTHTHTYIHTHTHTHRRAGKICAKLCAAGRGRQSSREPVCLLPKEASEQAGRLPRCQAGRQAGWLAGRQAGRQARPLSTKCTRRSVISHSCREVHTPRRHRHDEIRPAPS